MGGHYVSDPEDLIMVAMGRLREARCAARL